MEKAKLIKHKDRVELFYPWIRGKLCEIEDPNEAGMFLAVCLTSGTITAGKAQKMYERRFPKETLEAYEMAVERTMAEETPMDKLKREAINKRKDALLELGIDLESFEKEMEEIILQKKTGNE